YHIFIFSLSLSLSLSFFLSFSLSLSLSLYLLDRTSRECVMCCEHTHTHTHTETHTHTHRHTHTHTHKDTLTLQDKVCFESDANALHGPVTDPADQALPLRLAGPFSCWVCVV